MQISRKLRRAGLAIAGLAVVVTLASCGGGNDDGSPPTATLPPSNVPPTSASATPQGFIDYLKGVILTSSDSGQPIDVSTFVAPTDDTGPFDTSI